MSSVNVPTYEVEHLSFAKHPSLEKPFREALCIVNDAKRAAYYSRHCHSGWDEDDQGEEVLAARLKLANIAYTIILDYEKLAGTEFYNEVIHKGNPKPKIVSLYQAKAWREFRQLLLNQTQVYWKGECVGQGVWAIVKYLQKVICHSKGQDLSRARAKLKVYVDEQIDYYRVEHEECMKEAGVCRLLAMQAIEDGDHTKVAHRKDETNWYMSKANHSLKKMMNMQKMREQLLV